LDYDEFIDLETDVRFDVLRELNQEELDIGLGDSSVKWSIEDSGDFKLSKGVFTPPGSETSFIMAELIHAPSGASKVEIKEEPCIENIGPLSFESVRFYFYGSGVGTCSAIVRLQKEDGLSILELEEISEQVNTLYKSYFEEVCFVLTKSYCRAIENAGVKHHHFSVLPNVDDVDRSTHFIPWTHRIYHVEDETLFNMENPGEPFRFLLTPSRQMDVSDLSIYDNRYVYFGWGHSIIITSGFQDGFSQTARPVYDYVRTVEIAQAKWQFLDVLADIVKYSVSFFSRHQDTMGMSELSEAIRDIRNFDNGIDQILSEYRGVKITFDTEIRILLDELNERWLTDTLLGNLRANLDKLQDLLDQLYQRQKEQREEALNVIAFLFTVVGIIEVFALVIDIIQPDIQLTPFIQLITIVFGTLSVALLIMLYLRVASRG
jgi:hypothetical protein